MLYIAVIEAIGIYHGEYQKPKLTKHSQLRNVTFSVEAPGKDTPGNYQPSGGYLKAGKVRE